MISGSIILEFEGVAFLIACGGIFGLGTVLWGIGLASALVLIFVPKPQFQREDWIFVLITGIIGHIISPIVILWIAAQNSKEFLDLFLWNKMTDPTVLISGLALVVLFIAPPLLPVIFVRYIANRKRK